MPDPKAVHSMFARIAGRYDLANRLLSGGVDCLWRQQLVRVLHDQRPGAVLDLATGSGDVAFAIAEAVPLATKIVGMDFCQPMLDEALKKGVRNSRWARVEFHQGDGLALPLPASSFDAVTLSFGLRNMADRDVALQEVRRVLRPAGRLYLLEFSQPDPWFRPVYYAYLKFVLPVIAAIVTGDRSAYDYLGGSIERFPNRKEMAAEMKRAGFATVDVRPMTFGIVALHIASA